jgi:hypothetical protein
MTDCNDRADAEQAEVTPEMAEAGAQVLRERLEASYYWSRGVASEVFRAMMAVASQGAARTP